MDHPPSTSSPLQVVALEGGEKVPPKAMRCPPPPNSPCYSNGFSTVSKIRRWWKA